MSGAAGGGRIGDHKGSGNRYAPLRSALRLLDRGREPARLHGDPTNGGALSVRI